MATSEMVATTVIDTSKVVEHAIRRCKLPTASQTPEVVTGAQESLYMLLLSLANRGLNLWAVERQLIGTVAGQATYTTRPGTLDVLNVVFSRPTQVTGINSNTAASYTTQLASAANVVRIGVKFGTVTAKDTLTLARSNDGVVYTIVLTDTRTDWAVDTWYWYEVPVVAEATYFRASVGTTGTFSEFYLASQVQDIPLTPWNRDTYMALNDKNQRGTPSTNYFFEKKLTPQLTIWPVPDDDYNQLVLYVHRQVQDIGSLTQQIEIPQRWYEAIVWQLAVRVGFEHPQMDEARLTALVEMAQNFQLEADSSENDGMPVFIVPNIAVYNK